MKNLLCLCLGTLTLCLPSWTTLAVETDQRQAMIARILSISEQVIPNPAWLESTEWQRFVADIQSPDMLDKEDAEYANAFNRAAGSLPFSHYRLQRRPVDGHASSTDQSAGLSLEKADHGTAILTIDHLAMPGEVMDAMVECLRAGQFRHLVLDFRTTPGGAFPAGMALGRFLNNGLVDTGIYLTRRWFLEHGDYPTPEEIATIAPLEDLNLEAFARQLQQHGVLRIVLPRHDDEIFEGELYVLTSRHTASAAEPFVEALKRFPGRATIIGERTAGAMLSGERFPVSDDWLLFVPVADYMTSQGKRLDGVGVQPHVETGAEQALEVALGLIENRKPGSP